LSLRDGQQQATQQQEGDRHHEKKAVEAIENSAMSGNDARAVLDAGFTLEQRFSQIAGLSSDADDNREQHGTLNRQTELGVGHEDEPHVKKANDDRESETAHGTLYRFARRDRRNELLPSER